MLAKWVRNSVCVGKSTRQLGHFSLNGVTATEAELEEADGLLNTIGKSISLLLGLREQNAVDAAKLDMLRREQLVVGEGSVNESQSTEQAEELDETHKVQLMHQQAQIEQLRREKAHYKLLREEYLKREQLQKEVDELRASAQAKDDR